MKPRQTKLALVPTVASPSSGRPASSAFTTRGGSGTSPNAARYAGQKGAALAASDEIRRARDILRDVLLRDDESDELALVGQVSSGLNEIICTLDSLAGLQMLFENWSAS